MGNLVPERRMNKNGVMVTKHVRPGAPVPASGTVPPPPGVLSNTLREALKGRGARALTAVAEMEPGLRARFEAAVERRPAFNGIVGNTYRFDDFVGELVAERDHRLRDAAIGIVAAVDEDTLDCVVDWEVCRGLAGVPELEEHIGDLTSAPPSAVAGAQNLARFLYWLRVEANRGGVVLDRRTARVVDRELEQIALRESGFMEALSDWAFTDARALAAPEALKFFWRHPEHRLEFGMALDLYIGTDHDRSRLLVEHWDRREEITAMIDGGIGSAEAMRKVLEGELPGALASGEL